MLVFDVPSRSSSAAIRGAAFGSCRVREPFTALVEQGDLPLVAGGLHKSHTAREALMLLEVAEGVAEIEDFVLSMVFSRGMLPSPKNLREALKVEIDVVILEISSSNQFFYHDTPINSILLAQKLVQPHSEALSNWHRQVCAQGAADEDCVEASLAALRECGANIDHIEDLLRGIRLERQGVELIEKSLRAMMSRIGARWILCGPFVAPDEVGALMTDRRALISELDVVAERCGVSRWDPERLISAFGREAVLASNGRNRYHYAKAFLPTAGDALLDVMRQVAGSEGRLAYGTL